MNREKIYNIVEKSDGHNRASAIYDLVMIGVIIISIIPLAFKSENTLFVITDKITVSIFIIDYISSKVNPYHSLNHYINFHIN